MSRNNDYAKVDFLDFFYHQKYYIFTGIDLSRKTNTIIPQQTNFTGKLEEIDDATMSFCLWKETKIYSKFLLRFINSLTR